MWTATRKTASGIITLKDLDLKVILGFMSVDLAIFPVGSYRWTLKHTPGEKN